MTKISMIYRHMTPAAPLLLPLILVLAVGSAAAVEQTGDLQGVVRDDGHQPLPGVLVTLRGRNLQGERATSTDERGRFAFRALPPGNYSLKYSAPGFEVIEQEGVVLSIGRTTSLVADLIAGGAAEHVSVIGAVPLVDTARTSTQDNYSLDYLQKTQIGSGGRDYLSVIQNTAGTGAGDGANITVRGATIGENAYLIDGVDSTDPVTATFGTNFIFDAVQEVQVQTGGYAAEFGRATGGIINVVTKSGGNDFSGSVDFRFRNQNFIQKGDHFDPGDFKQKRQITEATFGGPIVRDKLWFFVAGSLNESDAQPAGSPTISRFGGDYYLAKLTWQATPSQKLVFQTTGDPATIDNVDASPLVAREATTKQTQGSTFVTAQYQKTFSPNLLLDAQVSKYRANLDAEPQSGDSGTIGLVNGLSGALTGNAIDIQHSDRFRDQANATLTWHVPRAAGEHTFKVGIDAQALKFGFDQSTPGGESDTVFPDANNVLTPVLYATDIPAGRLDNTGNVAGYFAQDEWRIHPRLTLNAGLRLDDFRYNDDRGHRVFSAGLLQPRVGVSWNMTGDARNVVKAYGGVFAHPSLLALPRAVNTRANATAYFLNEEIGCWVLADPTDPTNPCPGAGPFPIDFNGDNTIDPHTFAFALGGPGGTRFAHDGHLQPTNVVEYSLAYERQFSSRTSAGVTLVTRKTRDIIEDELNVFAGQYVIDNYPDLKRRHSGVEARFVTAMRTFHLWSSYSWGVSRGNIEYTQGLGSDFDLPVHETNRYGYLSDDARHTVRTNGYWDLPWSMQAGFAYRFMTGLPVNLEQFVFPYGTKFLENRGSARLPSFQQLDLDVRRNISLGRTTLQVIATVLNVLNSEIVTAEDSLDPAHQALGYQVPRHYEAGVRYVF